MSMCGCVSVVDIFLDHAELVRLLVHHLDLGVEFAVVLVDRVCVLVLVALRLQKVVRHLNLAQVVQHGHLSLWEEEEERARTVVSCVITGQKVMMVLIRGIVVMTMVITSVQ